jgi:hypothetical protein
LHWVFLLIIILDQFDNVWDTRGEEVSEKDNPWESLLKIFYKLVQNLHEYNQKQNCDKNSDEINEEQKASSAIVNHDESVRLQQEPETEEIEQKSNRDVDINKIPPKLLKVEEKESKKTKTLGSNFKANIQPNAKNSEMNNIPTQGNEIPQNLPYQNVKFQNWQQSPVKQQNVWSSDKQSVAQKPNVSSQDIKYVDQRQLPSVKMLSNINELKVGNQPPQNTMLSTPMTSPMKFNQMPPQMYTRNVQSPPNIPIMNQRPHVLPGLSNINFAMDSRRMQATMPPQYAYGIRGQQAYAPMGHYNYNINRTPQQPVQLPGLNQFVSSLRDQQVNHQVPNAYLNQLQLKNFFDTHQGMMQGRAAPNTQYNMQAMNMNIPGANRQWPQNNQNNQFNKRPS